MKKIDSGLNPKHVNPWESGADLGSAVDSARVGEQYALPVKKVYDISGLDAFLGTIVVLGSVGTGLYFFYPPAREIFNQIGTQFSELYQNIAIYLTPR
jgi:hypothetical protein